MDGPRETPLKSKGVACLAIHLRCAGFADRSVGLSLHWLAGVRVKGFANLRPSTPSHPPHATLLLIRILTQDEPSEPDAAKRRRTMEPSFHKDMSAGLGGAAVLPTEQLQAAAQSREERHCITMGYGALGESAWPRGCRIGPTAEHITLLRASLTSRSTWGDGLHAIPPLHI